MICKECKSYIFNQDLEDCPRCGTAIFNQNLEDCAHYNSETLKNKMIKEAKKKYGKILPCGNKTNLKDCFTYEPFIKKIIFWFNCSQDQSTRSITKEIK